MICKDCGAEFSGNFCPNCGSDGTPPQKKQITQKELRRLGLKSWFSAIGNSFLIILVIIVIAAIVIIIANR